MQLHGDAFCKAAAAVRVDSSGLWWRQKTRNDVVARHSDDPTLSTTTGEYGAELKTSPVPKPAWSFVFIIACVLYCSPHGMSAGRRIAPLLRSSPKTAQGPCKFLDCGVAETLRQQKLASRQWRWYEAH